MPGMGNDSGCGARAWLVGQRADQAQPGTQEPSCAVLRKLPCREGNYSREQSVLKTSAVPQTVTLQPALCCDTHAES